VAWAEVYFRTKWRLHPSSRLAAVDMNRKLGGCAPFTGFLHVRKNWKRSRNLSGQGRSGKVRENAKSDWKVRVMLSVAKHLQPFLKMFQVDKPMMPFLVPDLLKLVKDLLARFVQRAVVESLVTCSDVIGFDTNDIGKHCPAIEFGFSADKIIRSDNFKKKKVSDGNMLGVRTDAISVLKAMRKKLLQKTPITYPVARVLSSLDPRNMADSPEQCKTMIRLLLKAVLLLKRTVMRSCNSLMTLLTRV